ncbi:hypothetical protein [Natronoglomus mannanivorans]|uniref:Uncharacterized protein n=1 Tax=Natronoglomus mannanivorans TaxID=2979990 RepID=A0AAP2Z2C7_9EURY|nr:hypothetical protein [Halobacteria archaeon AArc-xg1-1]
MHEQVEWMEPSDRSIVLEVAAHMGWIKPASMALNSSYSRRHITDRCQVLADHDLIDAHPTETAYRIADLGDRFLFRDLEAADLGADSPVSDSDVTTLEFTEEDEFAE